MTYTDLCPTCKTSDWEYADTNIEDDFLIHDCYCPKCDSTWTEVFVFVENKNIVDGRISS